MQLGRDRPGSLSHPHGRQPALQETLCRSGIIRFISNPESNQFDEFSRCFTEVMSKTTTATKIWASQLPDGSYTVTVSPA